ncbi:MAG TPA: S9 family peptidase [Isosphaeraceae bacterium]|nr:S9 family peptidase [Isosphaeraceae bacterium]
MRRSRGGLCVLFVFSWAAALRAQEADRSTLTLDRVLGGEFAPEGFGPARWREKGDAYTTLEHAEGGKGRELVRFETATGRREVLVGAEKLVPVGADRPLEIEDYAWSDDGAKLLIFTNSRRVWRLHTRGDFWVLDLNDGGLRKLGGDAPEATLMFAKFAPDGRRVAFVRANDLYVEDPDGHVTRLTRDGSPSRSNGTFDWVYEEEFSLRDGFRWSPDGKSIAYWQVDDAGVKEYVLVNTTEDMYPKLTSVPYPKVGQVNPSCRVGVVSADGGETRWMEVPGDPRDHYIARVEWAANSDELVLQHLNRLQNTDEVMLADARSGKVRTVLAEHDDAWVDVTDELHWLDGGRRFTWPSERDGWRRLYDAPRDGGKGPRAITPPDCDVIDVLRVDDRDGVVDYIAAPDDPTRRYLFRAPLDGSSAPRRLTPADRPGTHSYQISPDGRWAFHTYSSFDRPPIVELVSLPDHAVVRTLASNAKAIENLAALTPCATEFFRVDIGAGVVLDGWCIKPPGFDPSKKYPVLVHVYGEPAMQVVVDQWDGHAALWHRMLAQRGYVVLCVDNRGTPSPRGRAWRKSVYRQIGTLAARDQAEALRALEARWPWIDRDRVGVWGWSGGGSMSLNAIFRYPGLYRTAIAVAAVPDQRLYDTIYQERYMGLPADNPDGYREGSPITHAGNLRGNLLVIHGTGDDNCHYQGCERLIDALVAAGKPFTMMAYPNRTHSISEGPGTTRHLFALMTRYLEQNLPPGPRE